MLSILKEYELNELKIIDLGYINMLSKDEEKIVEMYYIINKKSKLIHIYKDINIISLYTSILIFINPNKNTTNHSILNFITSNIYKFYIINNIDITYSYIRKNIYKAIAKLEISKLLNFNKKTIKKKTIKYVDQKNNDIYNTILSKKYSYTKYKILNYKNTNYTWSDHFFNIHEIEKKNEFNNKTIKFKSLEVIEKLLNQTHNIDWKLYETILLAKIKIEGYNTYEEIYELYNIYINNKNLITTEVEKKLSNIIKLISEINFFKTNSIIALPIYFQFSFDFRGRLYYDSIISPTNSKITRNSICYKKIEKIEIPTKSDYIISENLWLLNIHDEYKNIPENNKKKILWILISIGKIFKNKKTMSISDFINQAIKNIDNVPNDDDDKLDMIKYKYIHNKILNNDLEYIYTIIKDATASGLQHLIKNLKSNNESMYIYCNFNSDTYWYDTYSHLKDIYIKTYNINEKYHIYFDRNLIKKIIMIEIYGASKRTCIKEYIKKINNNEDKNEILKHILNFYDYLHNNTSNLFKNELSVLFDDIELNDCIININYNVKKKKQHSHIQDSTRKTIQEYQLTDKINIKKTIKAYKANMTHASDSYTVRRIICEWNNPIITIHDAFIIDIENISVFIDIYNKIIKEQPYKKINTKKIDENYYSFFIII